MLAPGLVSGFRLRPEVGLRWPELYSSHAAERQFRSAGVGYFLDPGPRDGAQNHPLQAAFYRLQNARKHYFWTLRFGINYDLNHRLM